MKSLRLTPCAAAVAIAALQMSSPAHALTCTLTSNGLWQTPGDWSCNARPGSGDAATINIGGLVTINQGEQITTLSNAGTINIDAFTLTLLNGGSTTNSGTINVGGASTAALQVFNDINNAGGALNVGVGSVINQFGAAITGGTITTTGTGALVANNNGNNFLNGVTLNGLLDMATAQGVERISGGMTLNGAVNINSNSILAFQGDQTIGGTGTITLGDTGSSNRINLELGNLVLGSGITIHGQNGTIGQQVFIGGPSSLVNNGKISADVSGGTINLSVNSAVTNNGILEAKNGGTLILNNDIIGNAGSSINVGAGSVILQNGVALSGAINTSGSGSFRASNSSANFLNSGTLNGNIDLASVQGSERIAGGLTFVSGSTININNNSILAFQGDQTISGNAVITLGDTGSSNRVNLEAGNLVLGSGITIHGQNGTIGQQAFLGGAASLTNNGTISADVAGGTINLSVAGTVTNNGVLSAQNGGTLVLNNSIIGNAGSHIDVGAGSTILQNGVTLQGIVNSAGTGNLHASGSGSNFFDNVTLTGFLDLASAQGVERVVNNLTLNGGVNINQNSILAFQGNQTISGTGVITLGDTGSSNRVTIEAGDLVLGSGITIHGQNGTIGQQDFIGGASTLTNNGKISADVNGGTITLGVNGLTTNNGVLEAKNGGTLILNTDIAGTAAGSINAAANSLVLQNGIVISGVINTTGSGTFRASNSGNNFLDNVTFSGNLDLAGAQGLERIRNGLVLNGNIAINNNSILLFGGDQTLSGSATITLGASGSSNRVGIDAGVLTLGANVLIDGTNGTIGQQIAVGGPATLVNNGRISADVAGGTINLSVNGGATNNNATLEARNGGNLVLSTDVHNSAAGHIDAIGAGSVVSQNGINVSGGTINSSGGGVFAVSNSGSNFLSSVSIAGTIDLATNQGLERISGDLNFAGGSINVNNNSILAFVGEQSITGTGNIVLGASGSSNRIILDAGDLSIGSGITIHGQNGTIGGQIFAGGAANLTNAGTILADVNGGLISLSNNGALVNNGTVGASNGGTLAIGQGFTGTGTIQTSTGGLVTLAGAATQGKLINDGNIALGANNVTITSDYSNANFGTGNSFNKRSDVTGTGQILASGNVAQAVTGSSVTNGTSASPTLTIGNVRVGGTTYNYQVANAGTTGPAIRGALETSVNGGNITDSRLSGAGVTASNYGPIATGANSGDLGVTFTVASAGALAPLSNQAVHIANNFDNVAEQTLNIVLGSGAAAYNAAVGSTTPTPVTIANQRIGGSNSQALTVSNTAPGGNFTEALNATFSGSTGSATTNGGSVSNLAAQSSNSSALSVGVNTTSAGAKTGSVTIAYQTDGTGPNGHSSLSAISAGSQTINVSGNVYQAAAGNILTAGPYNFGTVQVGQTVTRNLTIQNVATGPAGFVEDLNASFGSATDSHLSGSGSIAGLTAGSTSTAMTVNVNTTAAGMVNGSIAVNYFTAGAVGGVSDGLGVASAGSQNYSVLGSIATSANVIDAAAPVINTAQPIMLGNVRIGSTSPSAAVSVTNQATGNQQAALNASIAGNAPITASGSFNLLNPGATDSSSLHVGLDTSTAGAKNGTATISFVSDASNVGGCAPNCQMTLASQDVSVNGAVFRLANPSVTTPTVTLAARVGGAASQAIGITNVSPDIYTEGLTATRGATSTGFTSSGAITNLAAAGSSNAISVALNTANAGTFTGTQALNFTSTGQGTDNAADMALAGGSVTLNGKVYTAAVAQQNTAAVNFGIVHVGQNVAAQGVSVSNGAPVTALNDVLVASALGATGPFTAGGNLGAGLGAGQTSTNALTVGLNTMNAGVYSGNASFSAASHDSDLSDQALANLAVSLTATVNNYATDAFAKTGGAGSFSQSGSVFTLDYGSVLQGSGTESTTLVAGNSATGPADLLDGMFQFLDPADFGEGGFSDFINLAAGQNTGPLSFSFDTSTVGDYMDTIVLHGLGHNDSGYSGAIGDIELVIRGSVTSQSTTNVPEPDTIVLLGLGVPLIFLRRRRKAKAVVH